MLYKKITRCRICGNKNLRAVLNLGHLALTGVFPKKHQEVEYGPIELVKCMSDETDKYCGLLQLAHNYNLEILYGDNYGYRSGLNASMVRHLSDLVKKIQKKIVLKRGDLVIDIGANDGTLLRQYNGTGLKLVGIDPTIKKFIEYYPKNITPIANFFSSKAIRKHTKDKAKVITSIAMFYDLEHPQDFVKQIAEVLADDGIWMFEQSYMPLMVRDVMYDTVCHEHLEYYSLKQVKWMLEKANMKIVGIEMNDANGGSFNVIAAKKKSPHKEDVAGIQKLAELEHKMMLDTMEPYKQFAKKVQAHRYKIQTFLQKARAKGKTVYGLGASTKGNVILQYCNISSDEMPFIAEVNEYKFGRYTPATNIPIISETEARMHKPDYFMVLPWHFKENIVIREKDYLKSGGHLFFPLPKLDII